LILLERFSAHAMTHMGNDRLLVKRYELQCWI